MKRSRQRNYQKSRVLTGIAFYTREEWHILKQVVSDPDVLDDTYEDWQQGLGNLIETFAKEGVDFRKVDINVSELVRWCTEQGIPINGKARAQFAAYCLRNEQEDG